MIKPDTLCRVVRVEGAAHVLNGSLVTVTSPLMPMLDMNNNLFMGHTITPQLRFGRWTVDGIAAMCLQPISDPDSTDAVDEKIFNVDTYALHA